MWYSYFINKYVGLNYFPFSSLGTPSIIINLQMIFQPEIKFYYKNFTRP